MGGISEYFYDEVKFFDRYIMNSPVLSASCYNVTKDVMISNLAARKITPPEPDAEFLSFALSKCPDLKDQGSLTRDNLIKAAAIVGDKENQLNFLRSFSRNGILELYESGKYQKYLIYDLIRVLLHPQVQEFSRKIRNFNKKCPIPLIVTIFPQFKLDIIVFF